MFRIVQTDFQGDHNLGLFCKASDKVCIVGGIASEKNMEDVGKILEVPVVNVSVSDTHLCGIFIAMNSSGLLVPKIASEHDVKNFKEIGKKFGLDVTVMDSNYTALGNLVIANDNGAIISDFFSQSDKKKIEDCLDVESKYHTIAGIRTVGSASVATNKGCLMHRDAKEEEIKFVKDFLKVDADIGTANFGSPFVGSCMVANSNGCAAGYSTTGYEVTRIMEALKFL
ncbi:MAG TPA: translation initiation factor IF-6 [archaeon]|nr:translation initiation factor IF-6 [archaeon]